MKKRNLTRRKFITQAGVALSGASAVALFTPNLALSKAINKQRHNEGAGKMKWSMYTYTITGNKIPKAELDIVEMCRKTRELGIDGLDIIGTGYNKTWKEMKEIADSFDIRFVCYSGGVSALESPDASVRKKGMEAFRQRLEIAQTLGTPRIMMNQGGLSLEPDQNRKYLIESLKEALPIAKAEGVEVTIETHNSPRAPFKTSADFTEALAIVPDLRVTYDCGNNFINGEDPVQGYINNQDHITHMHFKDFFEKGGTCSPGLGVIDFEQLIEAMKLAGYSGYINLEMGGKQPSGWEVYETSMKLLGPMIA